MDVYLLLYMVTHQNNRDLKQDVLQLWSKFGDSSIIEKVMNYHADKLHAQNWVKSEFEVKFDLSMLTPPQKKKKINK